MYFFFGVMMHLSPDALATCLTSENLHLGLWKRLSQCAASHEDLNPIPRTHGKKQNKQITQEGKNWVTCAYNLDTGEVETGRSLELNSRSVGDPVS